MLLSRLLVVAAVLCWVGFGVVTMTQTVGLPLMFVLPSFFMPVFGLVTLIASCMFVTSRMWPKLAFLRDPKVVNGNKATVGIFLLFVALISFPGLWIFLVVHAMALGDPTPPALGMALMAFAGVPAFILLSLSGLWLVYASRPPEQPATVPFKNPVPDDIGP